MEKYTKIRNLGKGNMGVVQLVKSEADKKVYVMKLIYLSKMGKKERTASLNEAKVLSSLRHPNVINYVDSFLDRKTEHLCIVMEHAEGGDLSAKIKHQRGQFFPEDQIMDWLIQIALALQYCHQKRILHRDIKTQNIFLTQSGVCKIGDFGISRVLQNTFDCAHTFVGTPYYLSPELVQERPYNTQSDVWALGVVLYELMALRHPFNATDMKGLMQRILRVQYDPPPSFYSADLRSLVTKLLVKDPSKRLRVDQILQLPFIKTRIQTWATQELPTIPPAYLQLLRQNGLLKGGPSADDDSDSEYEEDEPPPVQQFKNKQLGKLHQPPPFGKEGAFKLQKERGGGGGEKEQKWNVNGNARGNYPPPKSGEGGNVRRDHSRDRSRERGRERDPEAERRRQVERDIERDLEKERERQLQQLQEQRRARLRKELPGKYNSKPSVLEPINAPHRLQPLKGVEHSQQQIVRDKREAHNPHLPPISGPAHPVAPPEPTPSYSEPSVASSRQGAYRRSNYHQPPPLGPKNLLAGGLPQHGNQNGGVASSVPSTSSRQSYMSNPSTRYSAYNAYYEARRQAEMYRMRNAQPVSNKPSAGPGFPTGLPSAKAWR
eukprot:TRINITY_DN16755_c0_g1_i1.p1 TRINITY_DN16755_c0_g1~~TRINITY_DN16755_c0_g1_i1.p1  ORF type:complete len:604 (+),score=30.10 TRINITY_DN16755_c0_g1_i1:85-1896(+)